MPIREVPTRFGGQPALYVVREHAPRASRLAIVFPGHAYPLAAPLLHYVAEASYAAGVDVIGVEYGYQANRRDLGPDGVAGVVEEVSAALSALHLAPYEDIVFIGKSIGTVVQTEVAQGIGRPIPHQVFLTPLRRVLSAIRETPHALVIVGDRDEAFGLSDIEQLADAEGVRVHVVPHGDHSLETGDYRESIEVLKTVATLCEDFVRGLQ